MSKFKVGDKVLRTKGDFKGCVLGGTYKVTGVRDFGCFIDIDGSVGGKYSVDNFELAEDSIKDIYTGKFKVGDKVRRTANTFGKAIQGGVYEVREVSSFVGINLVGHEVVKGSYNYDYRGFELAEESRGCEIDTTIEHLTTLQAVESLLNGETLEVITSIKDGWKPLLKHPNSLTIKQLKCWKFRLKPKTIVINGVDVPAPMSSLPSEGFVWGITWLERVYNLDTQCQAIPKHYWSTEEDAQKVLDAMLLPFK